MKIALDDPIWGRLYGAYGNRSVNHRIASLLDHWDQDVADDVYLNDLYHQDDIYPATFAALPWVCEFAPKHGVGFERTQVFISCVISCAHQTYGTGPDGKGPRGRYRGLSTVVRDHHHSWLPEHEWLQDTDQANLQSLEAWFSEQALSLAEGCLALVSPDLPKSAVAIEGFVSLKGGPMVADVARMYAEGEAPELIKEELGDFGEEESRAVAALHPFISTRNAELASFLQTYPGCDFVPHDPRQGALL